MEKYVRSGNTINIQIQNEYKPQEGPFEFMTNYSLIMEVDDELKSFLLDFCKFPVLHIYLHCDHYLGAPIFLVGVKFVVVKCIKIFFVVLFMLRNSHKSQFD